MGVAVVRAHAEIREEVPDIHSVEILQGDLFEISLASLLHLAQYEALSGWLDVLRRGVIVLKKGQVCGARCGALAGLDALRELLFHRGGRFSLRRGEPTCAIEDDSASVTHALMDAYRMRDEWNRLSTAVWRVPAGRPWQPVGGELDRLVAELDGRCTLAAAARVVPALTTILDPLLQAIAHGQLERVGQSPTLVPAPEVVADFHELVDQGREFLRKGDHVSAHALLSRALALRPDDRVVQQNLRALALRMRQT